MKLPWSRASSDAAPPAASTSSDEKLASPPHDVASLPPQGEPIEPIEPVEPSSLARLRPDGTYRVIFYRSVFWNITVLGLCSFLAPGLWGGLSLLGAGGGMDISTVNASNSITFCLMVLTCFLQPALVKLTNIKFALIFGTCGYAPYAAGLYVLTKYNTNWLVLLGATLCGITAGTFWATEGALVMGYPERRKQGRYLSYWLCYRVAGQVLAGLISLGLNHHSQAASGGAISFTTYQVFIALQAVGPLAACLLSMPKNVQRKDGTPVELKTTQHPWQEIKSMVKTLLRPKVLLLLPMIWTSTFSESLCGTFNATYFTVRSRALASLMGAVVSMISNLLLGVLLDYSRWTINRRAKVGFALVYGCAMGYWIYAIVVMNQLHKNHAPHYDWTDGSSTWGKGFGVYLMLEILFSTMYEMNYWIASGLSDDPGDLIRLTAIIRGVESAGQAVSYGLNSTGFRLDGVAGLNMALLGASMPFCYLVVHKLGVLPSGEKVHAFAMYATEAQREQLIAQAVPQAAADEKGDRVTAEVALAQEPHL